MSLSKNALMILDNVRQFGDALSINLYYPNVPDATVRRFEIGLSCVRAADNIQVSYDYDRDGWVIKQASIFQWNADDTEQDEDWQEVAFIQAWGRDVRND